jgi:hypothetical protein
VRAVLAVLVRAVRAFGACARLFAEPELAAPVREADLDAALRERRVVLVRPPSRDCFVVAMSFLPTRNPRILRHYPRRCSSNPMLVRKRFGVRAGFDSQGMEESYARNRA